MNLHRFDYNLLKTLVVLDEERSIQRAAARLFITPSAVSHALARLRRALADPLFQRVGLKLVPTARCSAAVSAARPLLAEVGRILDGPAADDELADAAGGTARTVTVVMPGALELSLLPRLAATLARQAPRWTLVVKGFERRSYEVDLGSGDADLVLSVGGHTPSRQDISIETLWADELVAVQGPMGPLPGEGHVDFDFLLDCPQVYSVPWPRSQNYLDIRLAREGRQRPIAVSMPSYAALGELVCGTSLIAIMPDRTALALAARHGALRIVRITPTITTPLSAEMSRPFRETAAGSFLHALIVECSSTIPSLQELEQRHAMAG